MSTDAPPYSAKNTQQDTQPPPYPAHARGWQSAQPGATPAPTYQPGTAVLLVQGHCNHQWSTRFGLLGILCAIFFCPLGFLCLLCDREEVCTRCGARRPPGF